MPIPNKSDLEGIYVHPSSYVDPGVFLGKGTKVWHFCHLMGGAKIGENCIISQNVMVESNVIVGNGCKIKNNVSLYEGVTLEDNVFCGPSCVFTNVLNPRSFIGRKDEFRPTRVKRGATIGANATIVCGVTLGEYCLVGAGAVVTKDVPPYACVVGNPARHIGWRSRSGEKLDENLVCPRDKTRYRLNEFHQLEPEL